MKLKAQPGFVYSLILLWGGLLLAPLTQAQTNTNAVTVTAGVQTTNQIKSFTAKVEAIEQEAMTFGLDEVTWLQPPLFGVPRWKYTASLIFIFLAFLTARILDWAVAGWLKRWAAKTPSRIGELVLDRIHGPIKVVTFVVLLHIGLDVFSWPPTVQLWLRRGLQVVVACSITYMALKLVDILLEYWRLRAPARDERLFDDHLFPLLNKSLKIFLIVVGILVTCQNLGLNVTAMLASLSIGGLALGLAAQDTVANLFGAAAVFVDKPFHVGDRIKLDGIDGVVETIGLRSTRVRNLEGHLITVPNKTMGNATITNVTRRPHIKTEMNFGITYDTSTDKIRLALEILREVYSKHPQTHELVIGFNKFADSALNINVVHWWRNTDYAAYVKGMEELNLMIKQRFDQEGIQFAFPTQTLYLKPEFESLPGAKDLASGRERTA